MSNLTNAVNELKPFRFWCQHVLPLVYDDSLSYYELLCKVVNYLNEMADKISLIDPFVGAITQEMQALKDYVDNWIESAHLDEEIDEYIDAKFASEEFTQQLTTIVNSSVTSIVTPLISQVNSRIDSTNSNLTNLATRVTNDEKFMNKDFSSRNFLFIGDSYTGGLDAGVIPWHEVMCNLIRPAHWYMSAEGGEGFQTNAGKHYLDRINDFISTSTQQIRESITDLFIVGGYNDIEAGVTDIVSAYNNPYCMTKCVEKCREFFPNARIIIAMVARTPIDYLRGPHNIIYIERCATAYREGAMQLGCIYVDRSELMLHDYRLYDSTHVHPNQLGCNYLGHYMAQWMQKGSWSYNADNNNNVRNLVLDHSASTVRRGHNTIIGTSDSYWTEQLTDDGVIIKCDTIEGGVTTGGDFSFDATPAITIANSTFNIGRLNINTGAYFSFLGAENRITVSCNATFKDNSNVKYNIPAIITFSDDNDILLNFMEIDNNGNWRTINGIDTIWRISGFAITLPLHSC